MLLRFFAEVISLLHVISTDDDTRGLPFDGWLARKHLGDTPLQTMISTPRRPGEAQATPAVPSPPTAIHVVKALGMPPAKRVRADSEVSSRALSHSHGEAPQTWGIGLSKPCLDHFDSSPSHCLF